ncbi:hypothetical protein [Tabrizicola sp.]|jgi:hypothetical protein|uniref:hypothetical protein n=1 Tax=Tabrizicola sp. TaxID=2005166 RepID=UPI001A3CD8C3|nr:hypothetical protein [Tabrizicola sp.]MBL9075437.1 hypothetical protein [Tabrizicola sp.]
MLRPTVALALFFLATPSLAETPITAEVFEAHVTGKTLTYRQFGNLFGIEQYLPDRKVRWSTAPNECQYGSWYPQGENICFVYEYDPTPACWTFWMKDGALVALSTSGVAGEELHEVDASDQGLPCPGPDVGV